MAKSLNKIHFKIIDGLSTDGEFCCGDLFKHLGYNKDKKRQFVKVDNALLDLCSLGCLDKHTTYSEKKYVVKYNGNYKDLRLFLDMVEDYKDALNQKKNLTILAERLDINKNLANFLINSKF